MPPLTVCTQRSHEDFKRTYSSYRAATVHLAYLREDGLILANCKLCGSTLTIPMVWEPTQSPPPTPGQPAERA